MEYPYFVSEFGGTWWQELSEAEKGERKQS